MYQIEFSEVERAVLLELLTFAVNMAGGQGKAVDAARGAIPLIDKINAATPVVPKPPRAGRENRP